MVTHDDADVRPLRAALETYRMVDTYTASREFLIEAAQAVTIAADGLVSTHLDVLDDLANAEDRALSAEENRDDEYDSQVHDVARAVLEEHEHGHPLAWAICPHLACQSARRFVNG
jgi:hypothetical protein